MSHTKAIARPISQSAQLTGLGERTLQRAIAAGALRAFKVGASTRILHEDLIAWLTARPVVPIRPTTPRDPGRDLTPTLSGGAGAA